jgi:hypothetical protein
VSLLYSRWSLIDSRLSSHWSLTDDRTRPRLNRLRCRIPLIMYRILSSSLSASEGGRVPVSLDRFSATLCVLTILVVGIRVTLFWLVGVLCSPLVPPFLCALDPV